jgi:serine/threonine-protein kinase RsbW
MEPGDLEVSCHVEDGTLVIQVRDWGRSFDPAGIALPDVTAPLEERDLGGLGMFLIYQFMDEVAYTFDPERGNELTMRKRLQGAESVTP